MDRRLARFLAPALVFTIAMVASTSTLAQSAAQSPSDPASRATSLNVSSLPMRAGKVVHVTRGMFGINVATWDYQMADPTTIPTIDHLGTGLQQFPNAGDWYNWQLNKTRSARTHYTTWNTYQEGMSLAQWGAILQATHNHGLYIVDYGTNATWTGGATVDETVRVTDYIVRHHIPVHAMVIGSEVYGSWAVNLHRNKSAREYAVVAKAMAEAIHRIDPTMLVGVDLMPIPLGPADPAVVNWNRTVLSIDAPYVQFVSVHYYPITRAVTDAGMLEALGSIPLMKRTLQDEVDSYAGTYAAGIQIWITEFNPYLITPTVQTVAPVYGAALAESVLAWAASGAREVVWWSLHGGAHQLLPNGKYDAASDLTPNTVYGTYALASDGIPPEPAVNTLYSSGRAYAAIMGAVADGAQLTVWPNELTDENLFVARIKRPGAQTWVLVNAAPKSRVVTVAGKTIDLASSALRIVRQVP